MKIIQDGSISAQNWNTQCTCYGCKSVLEIELSDVKIEPRTERDPFQFYFFTCPICQTTPTISEADIPLHIRKLIDKDKFK